jgi:hypothetical protein
MHILCGPDGGDDCSDASNGPWAFQNTTIDYNDFNGIHRFGTEMQLQGSFNVHFDHNSFHNPTDPWNWNFGVSNACCAGLAGTPVGNPGVTNIDNVLLDDVKPSG